MFDRAEADRFEALVDWIRRTLGTRDLPIAPASSDASFRRYYRVAHEGVTRIVMDAPPEREDCRVFADIAVRLARAGLHVPEVLAGDFGRGFLLLTDLGTRLYLDELDPRSAPVLYADAMHALHTMQERVDGTGLPSYDRAWLLREMELFRVWLLEKHLGLRLSDAEQGMLHGTFGLVADAAVAQPQVFVHRDYHSRNLLYTADHTWAAITWAAMARAVTTRVSSTSRMRSWGRSATTWCRSCAIVTSAGLRQRSTPG